MSVYAAHLRVYEPIASFPDARQQYWRDYTQTGRAPDRTSAATVEHQASVAGLVGLDADGEAPDGYVITEDGVTYVCPLDLALRRYEALEDFRDGLPGVVADAFVPADLASRVESVYQASRRVDPDARAHILTARWQVPLRWFVAFEPGERRIFLGPRAERYAAVGAPPSAGVARAVGYLTAMSRARRRVARALAVLRRTLEDGPVVAGVENLGRWLEDFHPHSLVELDYGGLVHLLDDDALRNDDSVAEVADAVAALKRGDAAATAAAYERVVTRWQPVAATEGAN